MNRREFLRTSAQAAAVLAAAACSSSVGGDSSSTSRPPGTGLATSTTRGAPPSLDELAAMLHGRVVSPADADFQVARLLYNPIYDPVTPRAVLQAADVSDVQKIVGLMRDDAVDVAIRGGGHSYGGWSTGSDLVLDVTRLRSIKVNRSANAVQVGPGVRLNDLYTVLDAQGVTVPSGTCPTVGITGITLAGGHGLVGRAMGLTCDSLQSIDIVTADGTLRHCDATHDPNLYWAARGGGGGSFGVVVGLTFGLHPTANVTTFLVRWAWNDAPRALAAWMAWVPNLPAQTTTVARLETAGPELVVAGIHMGTRDETRLLLAPLYAAAPTIARSATYRTFAEAMLLEAGCLHNRSAQCQATPPTGGSPVLGTRQPFVATSHYFDHPLPASAIDAAINAMNNHQSTTGGGTGTMQFDSYGGEIAALAPNATAFAHRRAFCSAQYASFWTTGSPDPHRGWLRATRATMDQWSNGGAYVGYADPELRGWAHAYWGDNLARLQQVKKKYDPQNLFRFPQSVPLP